MKKIDPPSRVLPEVRITASRLAKPSNKVSLYPRGSATTAQIDSLKAIGLGKIIGNPISKSGQKPFYGTSASDVIKKALNKK